MLNRSNKKNSLGNPANKLMQQKDIVAIYMWNVKPDETKIIPTENILKNEAFLKSKIFYGTEEIEAIFNKYFGQHKDFWNRIPHWIMKADLGRLLLIYEYGGFYFDADCVILENFFKKIKSQDHIVLFTEMILKPSTLSVTLGKRENKSFNRRIRIANYAFGTYKAFHPFLKEAILEAINRINTLLSENNSTLTPGDILWAAGPDLITSIYHEQKRKFKITLLKEKNVVNLCWNSWK